jgi:choline dehydrogenase
MRFRQIVFDHYDHIIVGAGSAGCVLANRLSADPKRRVLLLEAGPPDRNPFIHIPAGIAKTYVHPTLNWGYMTQADPELAGRQIYWPRGRTLGGSSAINGMIYIRGQSQDYDDWEAQGCTGWGWKDVLPLYREMERHEDGASEWYGGQGELAISHPRFRHAASDAFIAACKDAGHPVTPSFNGADQHGAGYYEFTIDKGLRASSATAFLRPARHRKNLTVLTGAEARRILFDGRKVSGLAFRHRGTERQVKAAEVILSAGAIGSPHLLLLSGVGPAAGLASHGVEVVHDLPGVGENLHDHLLVQQLVEVPQEASINREMRGPRLLPHILRYLWARGGLLTIGASQAAAFLKSDPSLERPDIQLMFKPYTIEMSPTAKIVPGTRPGWTTAASPLRSKSRGWLRLANADPDAPPLMHPNLLGHEEDRQLAVEGLRIIRRIFATAPLSEARETVPGPDVTSDDALMDFVRTHAGSMFHPVGSCRMGTGADAVVDPDLRVRGVEGLRVADASIMPAIVSGNTNAASIMIGAMAAKRILEEGDRP